MVYVLCLLKSGQFRSKYFWFVRYLTNLFWILEGNVEVDLQLWSVILSTTLTTAQAALFSFATRWQQNKCNDDAHITTFFLLQNRPIII